MKLAVVFPGQGSQKIGMGEDLVKNFSSCRSMLEEANDLFHKDLGKIMFEGPMELLSHTTVSQPAIFLTSMFVWHGMCEIHQNSFLNQISCIAGHSIGEYAALTAAGGLSFRDALTLIKIRSRAMDAASPLLPSGEPSGVMCAILGFPIETVQEWVQDYLQNQHSSQPPSDSKLCCVVNDNCPGQCIVAGLKTNVEEFQSIATEKGAKAKVLAVSGPFHSPWMIPVQQKLEQALSTIAVSPLKIPLVANYDAELTQKAEDIKTKLPLQVCHPVLWRTSVEKMASMETEAFLELGQGKVLSSLIRRTVDLPTYSIQSCEDIKELPLFP